MRFNKTSLIVSIIFLTIQLSNAQTWERLPDLLRKRGEHGSFVHNGNIYLIGGIHDHVYGPYNIEMFDTLSKKWIDLGPWPEHRHHISVGAAMHNNEIWICGGKPGNNNSGVNTVMVYNIDEKSWRKGPSLPRVAWGAPTAILNDKLHVIGGAESRTSTLNTHFVLDLNNESAGWSEAAALPKPVVHASGVAFNNEIWIIGGEIEHAHTGDKTWVQIYNPENNTWREGPSLPIARSHLEWSTFAANGKIWSVNGVDSSKPDGFRGQDEIFVYDPNKGEWELWNKLPHNFTSTGAKISGGYLYIYGGGADDWFDGSLVESWRISVN